MTQREEPGSRSDRPSRPMTGLSVPELGSNIAAPTAGQMLADFGAEVIKVDRPVEATSLDTLVRRC
jgi:formyl-CoA transferase